jgi:superfamily II DNA or RNA helicase
MELYEDQKPWCRAAVDAFRKPTPQGEGPFTKVMGVAATGAGKTIMAAAIVDYALKYIPRPGQTERGNSRVLFLADTDELVSQAQEKILEYTGHPTDREKASDRASLMSRIVVGSMQTLQNPERRSRYPADHFSLVIVDEAHGSMADTWLATMNYFHQGGAKIFGITATPERGDDKDLWTWWEHKSAEIGLFDLIAKGRLAKIKVKTLPIDLDCRGVKANREGLDEEQLAHAIEPAFEAIIEAWERHGEGRKTLWFLPGVPASRRFSDMLIERGHAARHIDGSSPDRKQILEGYARNQFLHLSNANLLIKGYDQPDIACVVNLSPGKSRVAYQQKVGRGTRVAKGKDDLLLLDFLWQFDRLGIVRPADLVARTKSEAERIQRALEQAARQSDAGENESFDSLDIHDQRDLADNQLVRSLIDQLVKNTKRQTRTYDASSAAALINAPELLNYEAESGWEKQPPTDRQKEILTAKGISIKTIKTRGLASKFLDALFSRQDQGLCTFKQAARLTSAGIEGADHMTFAEASTAMDRLIKASNQPPSPYSR